MAERVTIEFEEELSEEEFLTLMDAVISLGGEVVD